MPDWVKSAAFRLVIAIAMMFGMLLSPIGTSASHNPAALAEAEAARHVELKAQLAEHGHVHDDGLEDEQSPGHSHGHNPADHSHETPNILSPVKAPAPPVGRTWHFHPPVVADLGTVFRLERPPRPVFVA
ncbi:hypothetical protein N5C81_28695 [Rhizobium pusense]|uniref:hypothetical protein n=1 Tax=Agrobacterium pusense TaxID=648995 RepID=UPI00244AEEB8|nr:hypothetical protein [Agrobacterium pusense]MDH1271573.1 hypothetical protein [Agrobacterium pusense]